MKSRNTRLKLALAAGLMLGASVPALAVSTGTAAGTSVSNTATVNFSVGGVAQTAQNSTTATFLVDRKITFTVVTQDSAAVQVVPGATAQVTTFLVTNNSNSTEDFALAAAENSGGTGPFGGTDNFNTTNVKVYVESGTTSGFQAAQDTATFIDELAPGASATVYVVSDVPANRADGDIAAVTLTATAAQSTDSNGNYVATGGTLAANAAETNTSSADNTAYVDTVFGDGAGATDSSRDGKYSAADQYNVVTATIAVTKSSNVVSDPFNGTTNPKAIPGAVIEYCLDVKNSGSASASAVTLTDAIPANTTYVAGSMKSGATGTGTACTVGSGSTALTDTNTDSDGADYGFTASSSVTINIGSVGAGADSKVTFRVTVN